MFELEVARALEPGVLLLKLFDILLARVDVARVRDYTTGHPKLNSMRTQIVVEGVVLDELRTGHFVRVVSE